MQLSEVQEMSQKERLQAMELLWNAMDKDLEGFDSPKWHKDILDQRREQIENGEATFISIDELEAQVRG